MAGLTAPRARTSMRLRVLDARDRLAGAGSLRAAGPDLVEACPGTSTGRPDRPSFKDVVLARA